MPLLPCLLFLAVHVPASHGAPLPPSYDTSMCSESFWCGGVEIQYPFYLSNATEATADHSGNYSCGYTDLSVSCQRYGPTWTPIIRLGGDDCTVKNISYGSQTIVLADSDALVGDSCPRVRHNVSFDDVWLHNTTISYYNLTFFFGCHSTPRDPLPDGFGTGKYQINCTGFSGPPGGGVSFVFTPDELDIALEHELAGHCREIVTVPVRSEVLMASNQSMLTRGGYGDVLKQGFELACDRITTDPCYLCERPDTGGRCAYSQSKVFLGFSDRLNPSSKPGITLV